jgi:hypothetical protein
MSGLNYRRGCVQITRNTWCYSSQLFCQPGIAAVGEQVAGAAIGAWYGTTSYHNESPRPAPTDATPATSGPATVAVGRRRPGLAGWVDCGFSQHNANGYRLHFPRLRLPSRSGNRLEARGQTANGHSNQLKVALGIDNEEVAGVGEVVEAWPVAGYCGRRAPCRLPYHCSTGSTGLSSQLVSHSVQKP